MESYILIIVAIIFIAVIFGLIRRGMDRNRMSRCFKARGGELIGARWVLFGPGCFGKHNDRIYKVRYLDRDGNQHRTYCKTSVWSGVYYTEDRIEKHADAPDILQSLEEENRRLREEIERLKRGQT